MENKSVSISFYSILEFPQYLLDSRVLYTLIDYEYLHLDQGMSAACSTSKAAVHPVSFAKVYSTNTAITFPLNHHYHPYFPPQQPPLLSKLQL